FGGFPVVIGTTSQDIVDRLQKIPKTFKIIKHDISKIRSKHLLGWYSVVTPGKTYWLFICRYRRQSGKSKVWA
ncbi:MAG: hypothetical protein KAS32_08355, partial [Candidatus Peribacteraceae bacterium]|nr:hypothetical protein [Candidatus Peribacteraceae bacterium]